MTPEKPKKDPEIVKAAKSLHSIGDSLIARAKAEQQGEVVDSTAALLKDMTRGTASENFGFENKSQSGGAEDALADIGDLKTSDVDPAINIAEVAKGPKYTPARGYAVKESKPLPKKPNLEPWPSVDETPLATIELTDGAMIQKIMFERGEAGEKLWKSFGQYYVTENLKSLSGKQIETAQRKWFAKNAGIKDVYAEIEEWKTRTYPQAKISQETEVKKPLKNKKSLAGKMLDSMRYTLGKMMDINAQNLTPDRIIEMAGIDLEKLSDWGQKGDKIAVRKVDRRVEITFTNNKAEVASFITDPNYIVKFQNELGKWLVA